MKKLTLALLVALSFSFGSSAFAAKEVFERTKIHVNVGTLGDADTASLTFALASAAGNSLEEAIDEATGTVTARLESENYSYEVTTRIDGAEPEAKSSDAYFVKVDSETTTAAKSSDAYFVKVDSETTTAAKSSDAYFVKVDSETTTAAKPSEAYFVKVDRDTTTQTREHILLARQVGVPAVVVFLDVAAGTDPRQVEADTQLIREALASAGYDTSNSGVVVGSIDSALAGEPDGLLSLIDLIDTLDRCLGN